MAAEAFHSRSSRRAHQHSLDLSHGAVPSPPPPHQQQQQQPKQQDCNVLNIEANSSSTIEITSHQQPKHEAKALFGMSAAESRSSIANRIQQQVSGILHRKMDSVLSSATVMEPLAEVCAELSICTGER